MKILLVNPPVYDFSAYDFWAKPLGLLYLSSILKNNGHEIFFLDCMDRSLESGKSRLYGTGKYREEPAVKPLVYKNVRRKYRRFGLAGETISKYLAAVPCPELILVTSGMTYWYPGVMEIISSLRLHFKNCPILLGGTYATLCPEHAKKHSGADRVVKGNGFDALVEIIPGLKLPGGFETFPAPDYSFYSKPGNIVIRMSEGCPFDCSYCASKVFSKSYAHKPVEILVDEILSLSGRFKVRDIAFYDDALLFKAGELFIPVITGIILQNPTLRFHTPNGLHTKYIDPETARLMKKADFINPRLSLETTEDCALENAGRSQYLADFENAFSNLVNAGYKPSEIVVNILFGFFDDDFVMIRKTVDYLKKIGVRIYISEFSPVPGTRYWAENNLDEKITDPLLTNNSIFPLHGQESIEHYQRIKTEVNIYNGLQMSKPA